MHKTVFPRPEILVVYASLPPLSRNLVFLEFALKKAISLLKDEFPKPIFLIVSKSSNKLSAVRETLFTLTIFLPVFPLPLIITFIFGVIVLTIAIGFVIIPLSFIEAAIVVNHNPHTLFTIAVPVTNIVKRFIGEIFDFVEHDPISVSRGHVMLSQKHSLTVDRGE